MPAKKVNSLSDVIFGNKNIEKNAMVLPPNRGPISTDPEWNELVDVLQDLTIGHHHDGADSRFLSPRILAKGQNTLTIPAGQQASGFVAVLTGFNITGASAMTSTASAESTVNEGHTVLAQLSPLLGGQLLLNAYRSPTNWSVSTDLGINAAFFDLAALGATEPGFAGFAAWDEATPPTNTVTPVYGAARSIVINWVIVVT